MRPSVRLRRDTSPPREGAGILMKREIPVNAAPEFAPHAGAPSRAPSRLGGDLVLLAAGALLFFWRLGSHDLWPPDEPRFALVAKEMLARGDLCVLSLNDHLY